MTSTRKMLLGTAAATIAVTAGVNTGALAADAMLKKAPPVQYVKVCDVYGAGFWNIPGTTVCMATRGQVQLDQGYYPTKESMFVSQSGSSGKYTANLEHPNQQDSIGMQIQGQIAIDIRTMTSMGALREFVNFKMTHNTGTFSSFTTPGGTASDKPQCYKCFIMWNGWTFGHNESAYSNGSFHQDDLSNTVLGEKGGKWEMSYTWTPNGPGQPPAKGFKPMPDGWSVIAAIEDPFGHRADGQFSGPYQGLFLSGGTAAAVVKDGPLKYPDGVLAIHYEGDPVGPGVTPQNNPNFGLATVHAAIAAHNNTTIATGGDTMLLPTCAAVGPAGCGLEGPVSQFWGFSAVGAVRIYTPMSSTARKGALRQPDYIWLVANYARGALEYPGFKDQGNMSVGDIYTMGGWERDDEDAKWVSNGAGGYVADPESHFDATFQYHHILTDCTDPVQCWRYNLYATWEETDPGTITRNTDWTQGGLGKSHKAQFTANLIWGANGDNTAPKQTFMEVQFEFQYNKLWQDMPCNNNGNAFAATCGLATPLVVAGVPLDKDPSNWVGRVTITKNW